MQVLFQNWLSGDKEQVDPLIFKCIIVYKWFCFGLQIKNLAAEVCLDRAYVLELLRDPPPKLLMLSATLPDEKLPVAAPENSSPDPVPVESLSAEDVVVEPEKKVKDEAVHVMQQRWSAQKRVKKAHIETLEKVYRRSKRPTVREFHLYLNQFYVS